MVGTDKPMVLAITELYDLSVRVLPCVMFSSY